MTKTEQTKTGQNGAMRAARESFFQDAGWANPTQGEAGAFANGWKARQDALTAAGEGDATGGENLILSVHWEDGDPDEATQAMAARQAHAGHKGRGVVVSFAEAETAKPGFLQSLARFDVGEVLTEGRFRVSAVSDDREHADG